MKLYIQAKSKKALNEMVAADGPDRIIGTEYNMFNPKGYMVDHVLSECEVGTTVAIYSETQSGSPVAKSWGTWDGTKLK